MRMSGLSNVESPVSWMAERYGNGTGYACYTRKGEADHVERLLSFLPGSPTSQCAVPFIRLMPIALENLGGLIRGRAFTFCLTTAGTIPFLTRAPQNHDSRISPAPSLRPEQHSKVASVAATEEYNGLSKSQWHKGGVESDESADSTTSVRCMCWFVSAVIHFRSEPFSHQCLGTLGFARSRRPLFPPSAPASLESSCR